MPNQQYFYDRVEIYANNIPYLPDGLIRSFNMEAVYNTKLLQGFSPTGDATGKTMGNRSIPNINWVEYLSDESQYVNWRTFCRANPGAIFTIVPISIALGEPAALPFTLTGVDPTSIRISASGEGEVITRDCTFNAISASNL